MHAMDLYNCVHGISGANDGAPCCPNLAALTQTGLTMWQRPPQDASDHSRESLRSFQAARRRRPVSTITLPSLDPPEETTGTGLAGGSCTPYGKPAGTTTDNDQGIDYDDTKLNGGAPHAAPTDGGIASIDPKKLVRDPKAGCAPVYPWEFHPDHYHLRRRARSRRLQRVDRQAPHPIRSWLVRAVKVWTTSMRLR